MFGGEGENEASSVAHHEDSKEGKLMQSLHTPTTPDSSKVLQEIEALQLLEALVFNSRVIALENRRVAPLKVLSLGLKGAARYSER